MALRKKFPNAQLTDVIAANHPYIGGGIHSGIADKTDAAQTPSQVLRDFWAENGDELRRLEARMAADNEALRANRENITTPSETDTASNVQVTPAPSATGGASIQPTEQDRLYWVDVVKQAEASGNVAQYLDDKDIPKSTYYAKKKQYRL